METVPEPEGGKRRHRRRSRSSRREAPRPSGKAPLLQALGRRLSRRGKIVVCIVLVIAAAACSAIVRRLESGEASLHSFISAVGFAPAIFVTMLGAGTMLLAQAIGYKRKHLWLTTAVLIAYLLLHVMAWHRAYSMARDALEPQIIGDVDNPNPGIAATPDAIDIYVLGLYTIGSLSVISSFLLMRKLVRWSTPSQATKRSRDQGQASSSEPGPEGAREPAVDEPGLPEVKEVELSALDALSLAGEAKVSHVGTDRDVNAGADIDAAEDDETTKRRARRLFE
jgi:hypothetical protein